MKFHLHRSKTLRGRCDAHCGLSILATAFACAALFFASQCTAQSRFERETADHVADSAQDAVSATPQTSAAVATLADTNALTSVPGAPVPNLEEASLVSPAGNLSLLLAQDEGQSSSSQNLHSGQNLPSGAAPARPNAAKTKSPHHGLGVALAIVGSTALAVGVAAYALGGADICANEKSGGCKEAKDAGLVLMPVGGGVAITGFYLIFHH
jgi:hypothetical protein